MTGRRLVISPLGAADLRQIATYISRDNPAQAARFIDTLEARCRAVAASPEAFPRRDDLAPGLHMAVHARYLIFFRLVQPDTVRIERVLHGARNLVPLLRPG